MRACARVCAPVFIWCIHVFTSAMLELHLLLIGVLLGFDVSTVPEKEMQSWKVILFFSLHTRTVHQHRFITSSYGGSHSLHCMSFCFINVLCDIFRKVPDYSVHSQQLCVWTTTYFLFSSTHPTSLSKTSLEEKTKKTYFLFSPVFTCQFHNSLWTFVP